MKRGWSAFWAHRALVLNRRLDSQYSPKPSSLCGVCFSEVLVSGTTATLLEGVLIATTIGGLVAGAFLARVVASESVRRAVLIHATTTGVTQPWPSHETAP
eukprot:5931635-Amphidinium_carterae.1